MYPLTFQLVRSQRVYARSLCSYLSTPLRECQVPVVGIEPTPRVSEAKRASLSGVEVPQPDIF